MVYLPKSAWALLMLAGGVSASGLIAGQAGARAELIGSTVPDLPLRCGVRINLMSAEEALVITHSLTLHVPYESVNTLEYGQHVGRRYAEAILISPLILLSKARKHFVTVGYTDANGRQQALVFRVSKDDIRMTLVSLEARTGRRVEFQDDDARKAGKG